LDERLPSVTIGIRPVAGKERFATAQTAASHMDCCLCNLLFSELFLNLTTKDRVNFD